MRARVEGAALGTLSCLMGVNWGAQTYARVSLICPVPLCVMSMMAGLTAGGSD